MEISEWFEIGWWETERCGCRYTLSMCQWASQYLDTINKIHIVHIYILALYW